jgi:hypothetical protein
MIMNTSFIMLACILVGFSVISLWLLNSKLLTNLKHSLMLMVGLIVFLRQSMQLDPLSEKPKVARMSRNIKIYRFSRGDFGCDVAVIEDEHTTFSNIKVPPNTDPEVEAKMIDDAEREALKLHGVGVARKWKAES